MKTTITTNRIIYSMLIILFAGLVSCSKSDDNNPAKPDESVTDADGNKYNTVNIGTQTWMVENLKTTKYNDGTPISNVTDNTQWANLITGAYVIYDNEESNNTTYGKLYNWYAVNTGKLAPKGWHISTDAEWATLRDYFGGTEAGGKMKSTSLLWQSPNADATNNCGFTGLPGGLRQHTDGTFSSIGIYGDWWSATENRPRL
jgi:uncharacterized protein (TIGR02145 family)